MCADGSPTDEPGGDSPPVREPDAAAHSSGSTPPPEPLAEDAFVRSETKRLRRIAKELLPNEDEGDDLVQDVWLAALEHPPRERGRLSAWLRIVTNHAALRFWRKIRSREALERFVARSEAQPSVLDALEQEAAKAELSKWIDSLQPPYREVVRLHFLEGASPREIAERLSRPGATVRSQLKRGLEQLRARYDGRPDGRTGRPTAALLPWLARFRVATIAAGLLAVTAVILWFARAEPDSRIALESPPGSSLAPSPRPGGSGVLVTAGASEDTRRRAVEEAPVAPRSADAVASPSVPAAAPAPVSDCVVAGRTLDILGQTVADAEIWLAPADESEEPRLVGRSDSAGRFSISDSRADVWIWGEELDNGLTSRLRVVHPGTCEIVERNLTFKSNHGRMPGIVVDPDGTPVRGATVRAIVDRPTLVRLGPTREAFAAYRGAPRITDAEGRFEITRIHDPRVNVLVIAPGEAPFVFVTEGLCKNPLRIVLPPPASIQGTILDANGAPAAGVELVLEHPEPLPPSRTTTDASGSFRFELAPPGAFTLTAHATVEGSASSWVEQGTLVPGESRPIDGARLSESWTIRGEARVEGRALPGWTVTLEEESETPRARPRKMPTSKSGAFAFTGCAGESYTLSLRPPGLSSGMPHAQIAGVRPGGSPVEFTFSDRTVASAHVRGTLSEAPFPVGDAVTVVAHPAANPVAREAAIEVVADRETGNFHIGPLPPGDFTLEASHPTLGRWVLAEALSLDSGASIDLGRIPRPRSGTLLVHWTQSWGTGSETFGLVAGGQGCVVSGRRNNPGPGMQVDEAAHTVRIPDLLPGEYSLVVQGASVATQIRTLRVAEDSLCSVEVVLEEGQPAEIRAISPRLLVRGETVEVRIHGVRGVLEIPVSEEFLGEDLNSLVRFRVTMPQGSNRIEITTSGGLHGERTLEIQGHTPLSILGVKLR